MLRLQASGKQTGLSLAAIRGFGESVGDCWLVVGDSQGQLDILVVGPTNRITKPAGKGTGLGLSVSYDIIVHKHNGELLVDGTVGEGTKFTLKLPLGRSDPDYIEEIEDNCIHNKAYD